MGDVLATAVLRMLADLIEDAPRTAIGDFRVVPVVVDDLRQMLPLIEAVLRFNGTKLIDADSALDGIDLRGRQPDTSIRRLIEDLSWPTLPGEADRRLHVEIANDFLHIRFADAVSITPTNPGDRASLALYTSLLVPEFDSALGAIAYDETAMDEDSKELAWRVIMDDLPALMSQTPTPAFCRTLIAFVGAAQVDWGRHCRAGAEGARYICSSGRVTKRHPRVTSENTTLRIAQEHGSLVLYLGAGASVSSNLPTGDELRDSALRRMLPSVAGGSFSDLARAFFADVTAKDRLMANETGLSAEEFLGRLTLERVLREEILQHRPRSGLSPTLAEFDSRQRTVLDSPGLTMRIIRAALHSRTGRLVLLTVNFDQMIEHDATILRGYVAGDDTDIAGDEPAIRLFVTDGELATFPSYFEKYRNAGGIVPLLKLHGSIETGDVRANVDDTLPGLSAQGASALGELTDEGEPITWVYVGCSMRDLDVQAVTNEGKFARGTNEYWVAPVTDSRVEDHIDEHRREAWRSAGALALPARLISWSSDEFFEALSPYIAPS